MLKRLAVLRPDRALGAQSSTLPPAVRRPCTHGDIGRVLHQPWLSRARLMMPPQVAMLSVQRGRLSALSDVRRRLGQHSAGRTAAKLVVRARACFQRSEACWCISLAGWASERLRCGPFMTIVELGAICTHRWHKPAPFLPTYWRASLSMQL